MSAAAGAYGFRVRGLEATPWLSVTGADKWPSFTIRRVQGGAGLATGSLAAESLVVDISDRIPLSDVVHPGLGRLMLRALFEAGQEGMHAGALVGEAGAWLVCGPKFAGKSTLLAASAARGLRVLADDVVWIREGRCLASPRCIDLRAEAADWLGVSGTAVRSDDHRVRLALPPEAAEHALAGFVFLDWGAEPAALRRLSAGEAVKRLVARPPNEHVPRDRVRILDLAALPAYSLVRSRDWNVLDTTIEALRAELGLKTTAVAA